MAIVNKIYYFSRLGHLLCLSGDFHKKRQGAVITSLYLNTRISSCLTIRQNASISLAHISSPIIVAYKAASLHRVALEAWSQDNEASAIPHPDTRIRAVEAVDQIKLAFPASFLLSGPNFFLV